MSMHDKIDAALDGLDDGLDEADISGAAYNRMPESQFSWEVSTCERFVRVYDGETWFADAEDFLTGVEAFAEAIVSDGRETVAPHDTSDEPIAYLVHQTFCDTVPGSMYARDTHAECRAAFAIVDSDGQGYLERAGDLDELRTQLLLLKAAAEATTIYKLDEVCDLDDLPNFGGAEPADTAEIWSWDERHLMVGNDFELVSRAVIPF